MTLPSYLRLTKVAEVWDTTQGEGITVGVLDSGVGRVEGLSAALGRTVDAWGAPIDDEVHSDHGTQCASLIASDHDDAPGVAPACRIDSVRITDTDGDPDLELVVRAMDWAALQDVPILLCSITLPEYPVELAEAVATYVTMGGVLVASAGKVEDYDNAFPAECVEAIVVGGLDEEQEPLAGSNLGPYIIVWAPARELLTLKPNGEITDDFGGSSGAAAIVAGICALMMSAVPEASRPGLAEQMKELMSNTTTGSGMVDAQRLLRSAQERFNT